MRARLSLVWLSLSAFACDGGGASGTSNPLPVTTTSVAGSTSSGSAGGALSGGAGGATVSGAGGMGVGGAGGMGVGGMGAGGMGTTASSSSSGGGGGMPPTCDGATPVVLNAGSKTQYLLKGMVLAPGGAFAGEVYVDGNVIQCVAASCAAVAAPGATVIDTQGIVSPGLIDTHNHILFDIFDETDWSPTQSYSNHNQWPNDARYKAMVDAKQYLNGETVGSPDDLGCELDKYGEMKGLIAGTTSIQGSPGATNKACYGSVARTIDQKYNGLPADLVQTATVFPTTASADGVCANFASGKTDAYLVHIGEGVDATAHNEFNHLFTVSTVDGCLYDPKTTIIHGTALDDADFAAMAMHQMSLTWSPRSNVFLYGAGSDLTKTTDVSLALLHGVNVSIGPDWSIGGSQNMLDELRYANLVDDQRFGDVLDAKALWEMATVRPARALGLTAYLGTLEVGKRADIAVFSGDPAKPYDAVLAAAPGQVRLVMVDGRVLYGDAALQGVGPADATCEALDLCGCPKFACIALTSGTPADKLGQTLSQITQVLSDASVAYDALNLSQWDFAPIAPLLKCN